MLILLPPSEGKTAPTTGAPVDVESLSHPGLNEQRHTVLRELARVSAQADAHELLGVGASLTHEIERNRALLSAPAAPSTNIYSGVLFEALNLGAMSDEHLEIAAQHVRVVSALWGLVSPTDVIPAYRLSMGVKLGELGALGALWRKVLDAELAEMAQETVVIDCRSAAYAAAWKPAPSSSTEWVSVKVVRELDGKRSVVSHNAKHTRGLLARHMITRQGAMPTTAQGVLEAAREYAGFFEVSLLPGRANAFTLEVVVREER
ncbi:YaaA family protein [Timonella sp. A28]|uniref:YaaA family protein n=1 Tax=Timonella sp. A28 TaxID=3442640 RepID=UPI003EBCC8FB